MTCRSQLVRRLLTATLLALGAGCAVRYHDPKTGVVHLWGFGHMRMKVGAPGESVRATVLGTDVVGAAIDAGRDHYGISLGWNRRQFVVVSDDAAVRFEWPDSNFFRVQVGTLPPPPPHPSL